MDFNHKTRVGNRACGLKMALFTVIAIGSAAGTSLGQVIGGGGAVGSGPAIRLCEDGEPELVITHSENLWYVHAWNNSGVWAFSVYDDTAVELSYGWVDETDPSEIFISSQSIDGELLEANFSNDSIAETVTVVATLTTAQGTTSPVSSMYTSQQFQDLLTGYIFDECDPNSAGAGASNERPFPLLAAAAAAIVWAAKRDALARDARSQWRDGAAACGSAFAPGSIGAALCYQCCLDKLDEDLLNTLALNAPDDDYGNCITRAQSKTASQIE